MKKLFDAADIYIRESNKTTIAAMKFCLLSLGMIIGMLMPEGAKQTAFLVCGVVFIATYVPLMAKLVRILRR